MKFSTESSAMQHIDAGSQPKAVQQFLLSLQLEPDGSIIELNGRQFHISAHDSADLVSVQAGIDDLEAGRTSPVEEVDARLREKYGFPPRT
jgi:hypothetical protein